MKVCFFAHYSFTNQDGATLSMYNIIEEMIKRGMEVSVVLSNTKNISNELLNSKVKFIKIPLYGMRMDIKVKNILTKPKFFIKSLRNKLSKRQIIQHLKADKPDVIHINGLDSGIGAEIAQKLNIPYVWHIRQFMEADLGKKLFCEKHVYKLVSQADSVIAISKDVKNKFEPIINRSIKVIYNGIPQEKYDIQDHKILAEDNVHCLLAGRISSQKGQITAIKAIEILIKKGIDNIYLTIIGQGETKEYVNKIMNYIDTHGLKQHISVMEHSDNLLELRRQHDIGLTCSKREAFGRVTIENMMAGMLAIGANSGGTPEIITDCENGYLYEVNDSKALANVIFKAISNKNQSQIIAQNGHSYSIDFFSIKRVVNEIIKVYENICI